MEHADIFAALAHPVRRALMSHLVVGQRTAGSLAAEFDLSRPAVSEHLAILKRAGLVQERKSGRERHYALDASPLAELRAWLEPYETYWRSHLARLADQLETEQ